jgi:chromate transporter
MAAGHILDGINVASLALMTVVTWQLARSAIVDWLTLVLAIGSAVVLVCFRKANSAWLIVTGAALGIVKGSFG